MAFSHEGLLASLVTILSEATAAFAVGNILPHTYTHTYIHRQTYIHARASHTAPLDYYSVASLDSVMERRAV